MKTALFHSVNSALFLYEGQAGLLIDAIHTGPDHGFSTMPPPMVEQLRDHRGLFAHVDGLLFTHLHSDHFDRKGLHQALAVPDPPLFYAPGLLESDAPVQALQPGLKRIRIAQTAILAIRTKHDGKASPKIPHESFLIETPSQTLFVPGDAALDEALAAIIASHCRRRVDAAFFNLYQLALPDGQAFIRRLNPRQAFLYHLPFEQDDIYHYRTMARQIFRRYPGDLPPLAVLPQMGWLDGKAPAWME